MKKHLFIILYFCLQTVFAQTNIAVPSYSSVTNSFNASTGNIKFYLNGTSQTLTVGRGANAVCFFGSDMFVAMDDNLGTKGIIWYANVSFTGGTFSSNAPVVLGNGQGTFSVAADASGNIYSANNNGTVTKFIRNNTAPNYSAANVVTTSFWANGGFAEASGVFVDNDTQTLWAVSYANNQGAVVKLSDFAYADGFGNNTKIKRFADNNVPNSLIQKPEGIAKDASGNIWIANNNNNYVLRLNSSVVTTFINDLNIADYSFVTLNSTQLNDFAISPSGHQLGGLVYDNLYSSKMYVNDQAFNSNTSVYSYTANNSAPVVSSTSMTQIFPGAGQCAIIPCALLPTPNNPTANGTTINSGQTATLTTSGCAADQTYLWKQGLLTVGTNVSFTTPPLSTNTTYTSHCVRGGTCESSGINVTVTVNAAAISVSANPTTVCAGSYSQLTATGCAGNVTWSTGQTSTTFYAYPTTTTTYTATCSAGGSSSATVTVNPNPDPTITSSVPTTISDCGNTEVVYLHTNETTTLTATGCTGTITWTDYTTTSTGNSLLVTAPSLATENGMKYLNVSCSQANGCLSYGFMTILNQFATDDNFSTTVNTPFTGNVITNDTETSVAWGAYGPTTTSHGTIVWTMGTPRPTGQFTYTPNAGFEGTDTFTYFVSDDLTCSKRATVTITVGSPCVSSITVNTTNYPNYTANQVVQASEFISTTSPPNIVISTSNSNKLTYKAGKSVILNPGFSVNNGAVFSANIGGCASQQRETMYMQGRHLYDVNGQKVIPVGLNYPTDYWQFSGNNEKVNEVNQSGANMARIIWFQNPLANTSHTDADLNTIITKFAAKKIIPLLNIWDGFNGCPQDPNKLNSAGGYVSWWTDPTRVAMLNTHKKYLVINLVNELGFGYGYNPNNPADIAAFTNWRNQYKTAISTIRNAGLHVPIMIDAPLCGGSLALVNQAAAEIINHDPDHNIIFSVHAYWAIDDESSLIATSVANNVPVIFGEISSKQVGADDWNTNPPTGYSECYYGIDGTATEHTAPSGYSYKNLLPLLKNNEIGWLHWEWFNDGCSLRNMTTDGNYINLTTFGQDAVNNASYGIKNIAIKSNGF